jgi:Cu/Ag efflux protein CusF
MFLSRTRRGRSARTCLSPDRGVGRLDSLVGWRSIRHPFQSYYMDMRTYAPVLLLTLLPLIQTVSAQTPAAASRYISVIGTVEKVDPAAKVFGIKTDKSGDTTVKFDDKTSFLRIPAGETDMKKATPAKSTDVGSGDRILARVHTEDATGLPALTFYITKQAEIAQRQQKTLAEWQTQGVAGTVKAVDAAAKQITITVRGGFGPPKDVTLDVTGNVDYKRYSPDSAKYEPGVMASIQPGDQLRVLGQKNDDQTQIKADAIESGLFKTVPVQIKSIDAATGQILATDLATKKPITVLVKSDTTMKKLDEATATMMARRLNPAAGGGRGPGGPGGGGGRGTGGGGGRAMDLGKILEQQPAIQLSELKPGDPVVVTGSPTSDMTRLAAMTLVAGVEPILRAAPQNGPDPLGGSWNLGDGGPPQ